VQAAPRSHACELLHARACHHCDAMRCDAACSMKHANTSPGFIDSHVPPQECCHGDGASIKMLTRRPFATSRLQLQQQCSLRESTDGEHASPQRLYMHGCMRRRTLQRSKLCACGEKCHVAIVGTSLAGRSARVLISSCLMSWASCNMRQASLSFA
jgi:hypothetical protein